MQQPKASARRDIVTMVKQGENPDRPHIILCDERERVEPATLVRGIEARYRRMVMENLEFAQVHMPARSVCPNASTTTRGAEKTDNIFLITCIRVSVSIEKSGKSHFH